MRLRIGPPTHVSHSLQPTACYPRAGYEWGYAWGYPRIADSPAFNWFKSWYAVHLVHNLDKDRPHGITLLGRRYVVWWEAEAAGESSTSEVLGSGAWRCFDDACPHRLAPLSGAWRCFDDACPHRLAPLSEGRIESDGTLQCSYHGWRFGGSGKCTTVPQAEDSRAGTTACSSLRSAATSYPTQMLALKALPKPPPRIYPWQSISTTELKLNLMSSSCVTYPIAMSYEMLLENLVDPSHLPFSHHGIGLTRDMGGPSTVTDAHKAKGAASGVEGRKAAAGVDAAAGGGTKTGAAADGGDTAGAAAAGVATADTAAAGVATAAVLLARALGEEEHFSEQMTDEVFPFPTKEQLAPATFQTINYVSFSTNPTNLSFFAPNLVQYLQTKPDGNWTSTNLILTPTMPGKCLVFLCSTSSISQPEDYYLATAADEMDYYLATAAVGMDYYLATGADGMVARCSKWLHTIGGGEPPYPPGASQPPTDLPRSVLLDRYESHTKHCKACSSAMKNFQIAQFVAAAGVVASLIGFAIACGVLIAQVVAAAGVVASLIGCAIASGALLLANLQYAPPIGPASASLLQTLAIGTAVSALAFALLWKSFAGWKIMLTHYVHSEKH
eukprot:gene19915-26620_t